MLGELVLAIVAASEVRCERLATTIRGLGPRVDTAVLGVNDLATLSVPGFDGIILDVDAEPARFFGLRAALGADSRTRDVPVLALASTKLTLGDLAGLGNARFVASDADVSTLGAAITELARPQREALDATRAARDTAELLQAAERFGASMQEGAMTLAHDVRALAGVIVGYGANLRDEIVGKLEETQHAHVLRVLEAADDVAGLVERFAVLARTHVPPPDGAVVAPPRRPVARRTLNDLSEIVRTTAHLFDNIATQKSIELVVKAEGVIQIWCDAMQLKQVITNLLVNALKFTPDGGRVTVDLRLGGDGSVTTGAKARRLAELVVSDTGPGVPDDERERIFTRGQRLERDTAIAGSGIGLSVVKELVAAHGGTIKVTSAGGGGASFVVALPIDLRTRRERGIVLVDDADAARRLVAALASLGVREVELADGDVLASALGSCAALVAVPRGTLTEIEAVLRAHSDTPSPPSSRRAHVRGGAR